VTLSASVSTNDGDTWSEPVCVFDHHQRQGTIQFAYANAILFHPPGQEVVWCFAMRCPMNFRNSEDAQLVAAFSGDGGRSWSPVELAMHYSQPLIVVAGIECIMDHGHPRYLLPAHRNNAAFESARLPRSICAHAAPACSNGRSRASFPQPVSGKVFLHEGGLARGDAEGELKLVMRTANWEEKAALEPPRAFSSVSKDGGRTWSPAQQEPELWNARSKGFYGRSANGTHLYVYNDGPAMPAAGARTSLRYKLQPAGGAWGAEQTFYDSSTHNSYPTLIEIAPGDFRAVWDSGTKDKTRTHIRFGKFHLQGNQQK
jgi:hypothetical protein